VAGHKEHVPWTKLSSGLDVITSSGLFMAFLRASFRFVAPIVYPRSSRFFNRGEIEIGRAEYFPTSRGQILFWLAALITQYGGERADRCETRGPL
jgi:phenylpropionate dioxygenase-like ring-hydroxylating dioxygenase large terminal subunit